MQRRETGPRTFGSNFDARSALIDSSEFLRVSGFWNQSEPMALDPPFLQNNTRLSEPAQPAGKSQIPSTPPKLEQLESPRISSRKRVALQNMFIDEPSRLLCFSENETHVPKRHALSNSGRPTPADQLRPTNSGRG